ncbi:serine hydrolase [Telluribacter sp. SYSU D00476]|uniref:serine hydrolase domain-containing protein n=1 Tax=Telluribacter sp. SYSU D00476 TaxID=2811430 RepID=UPI001FF52CB1|nr:serine hydrolase domain-containing protein [Telluribacter sp. SYSU D00476]
MLAVVCCVSTAVLTGCEKEIEVAPAVYDCAVTDPGLGTAHPKHQVYHEFLQSWKRIGLPGSILLVRDKHGLWVDAAGKADLAGNVAMKPCNLFYMASITKTFTAAAALKLHEMGLFHIDEPAIKYLPEFAGIPHGDKITIRQLMNHTSGIGNDNFTVSTLDYFNHTPIEAKSLDDWLKILQKPRFAPGTSWEYSSGLDFVGVIMARVSGKSAYQVIEDEILVPLGLRNTYLSDRTRPEGLPKKYMDLQANGKIIELKVPFVPAKEGALDFTSGGGISNAHDLMKFAEALFKGNLLKPETLELMKESVPIPDGLIGWDGFPGYGLGLSFVSTPYGSAMGHEGDLFGASSFMFYFPEQDITVVGAMNVTSYPLRLAFADYKEIARVVTQ